MDPKRWRLDGHLALVTGPPAGPGSAAEPVVAMVALEDLVRDLVGVVRDGTGRA